MAAPKATTTETEPIQAASLPPAENPMAQFADAIAKAIAATQPERKKSYDEISPVTPFNPTGKRHRELAFPVFQNGNPLPVDNLHDEEISLCGQLKPGKFAGGLFLVTEKDTGGGVKALYLSYKNATADDRMNIKGVARNLTEILRLCVDEANHGAA